MAEIIQLMMQYKDYIFLILFVWLLFYVLKENSKRETKYQDTIKELSTSLNIVAAIQTDVKEIKEKL